MSIRAGWWFVIPTPLTNSIIFQRGGWANHQAVGDGRPKSTSLLQAPEKSIGPCMMGPMGWLILRFLILKIQLLLISVLASVPWWVLWKSPLFSGHRCGSKQNGPRKMTARDWLHQVQDYRHLPFDVSCQVWRTLTYTYWCLAGNLREWSTG